MKLLTEKQRKKISNLMMQMNPQDKFIVEFNMKEADFIPRKIEAFDTEEQCKTACRIKMKMIGVCFGVKE